VLQGWVLVDVRSYRDFIHKNATSRYQGDRDHMLIEILAVKKTINLFERYITEQ